MATMGKDTTKNFFASAMTNRLALMPGAGSIASYGNGTDGATAAAAYNSRVLASQTNGAGPVSSPAKAPFSFVDFATGKRSLTGSGGNVAGTIRRRGR